MIQCLYSCEVENIKIISLNQGFYLLKSDIKLSYS